MRIITIGRGHIGGGLAQFWRAAGHQVEELGRDGGDVSEADVVLVAVPGPKISEALAKVTGLAGKIAIDTSNPLPARVGNAPSYVEEVKSFTGGPVAKSFNWNYAGNYAAISEQRVRPSNLYVSDEGAREVTEQLIRDAGFDPIRVGDLSRARAFEDAVWLLVASTPPGGLFYRFAKPGEL
ncbi:NADPH-dependent F420 reductase [Lacisediminihabitans profunda]|uniref:Dinucleotide-binding protein n=1 Tax=Lacisediminihabitans profunda TaxID=2594790 RepID=A0A5C8USK0_9MICO|nr:dinucleotide-binding protein [Lacisediminihabitans profunda]TXN30581.1 dinucleotide-binding protein [Lacisediminihabitans profunda]